MSLVLIIFLNLYVLHLKLRAACIVYVRAHVCAFMIAYNPPDYR